jgi:hypothetical protein
MQPSGVLESCGIFEPRLFPMKELKQTYTLELQQTGIHPRNYNHVQTLITPCSMLTTAFRYVKASWLLRINHNHINIMSLT